MIRLGYLAVLAIALTGCVEKVQNAPQPGDRYELPPITWYVVDKETLASEYQRFGMEIPEGHEIRGFVGTRHSDGKQVIYSLPPKYVNDESTRDLGHELLHIAIGDYHK